MRTIEDLPYSRKLVDALDPKDFPLTHKVCTDTFDGESVTFRMAKEQELDHPVAVVVFEEKTLDSVHIYSLEVHPKCQLLKNGRDLVNLFKTKYKYVDLTTLPESKIFYEKLGFTEEEDNHMVWRKLV